MIWKLKEKEDEDKPKNYLVSAFFAFWFVLLVKWLWPNTIPYGFIELWQVRQGNWLDWLKVGLPIFIWGGSLVVIHALLTYNDHRENEDAEGHFVLGTMLSIWAGVMEEICFRWLLFMSAIVTVNITNYLFFGWLGFGIPEWLHLHVVGPIANFTTLGYLKEYLVKPESWALGAALLSTNAFFRDGHKYQGFFGYVNSWFGGMFLFWVMLHYGLPAAILIHFVYDFIFDVVKYIDRVVERNIQQWRK